MATPVLSPTGSFKPRKEFRQLHSNTHDYALVSFNGNELLRLANFPEHVVTLLRKNLQGDVRHFREDTSLSVAELVFSGRPFAGRSLRQEQIVLDIISSILSQHFTLVSPIDYGRIYLDKLTLVFRRPVTSSSPDPAHVAFGISFVNTTTLRVVSPPLSLTPAILQVVRSAWPHGVVSEKRDTDGCYTFKLKGYSFFKQSTFETDSLSHTLSLLRAMDGHGIALLASVNLAKRSRIQDLWIFGAPAPALPTPELLSRRRASLSLEPLNAQPPPLAHSMIQHKDSDSSLLSPFLSSLPPRQTGHMRSASNPHNSPQPKQASSLSRSASASKVLRKPAPSPTSPSTPARVDDAIIPQSQSPSRVQFASTRNDLVLPTTPPPASPPLPTGYPEYPPNSTPVVLYPVDHQPDVIYSSTRLPEPVYQHVPSSAFQVAAPPAPSPSKEWRPVAVPTSIPPRPLLPTQHDSWEEQDQPFVDEMPDTPGGLLSPTAFRDTGYSTSTNDLWDKDSQTLSTDLTRATFTESAVIGVKSAIDENHQAESPLARSPRLIKPDLPVDDVDEARRRSEKALLGFIHPPPPPPLLPAEKARHEQTTSPVVEEQPTTPVHAIPSLPPPTHRQTVEIPMTVRDSDMGAGGAWVVVHEPGTTGPNTMKPPATRAAEAALPPGAAKPAPPPISTIPSDGDQSAFSPRVVSKSKKGFGWSRKEKKEKTSVARPSSSTSNSSPDASTPSVESNLKPSPSKGGIFRRKPTPTTAPNNRLTID